MNLKRRSANDAREVVRPAGQPVHPLLPDPQRAALAQIEREMAEARAARDAGDRDSAFFVPGRVPAVGFNPGGVWRGTR